MRQLIVSVSALFLAASIAEAKQDTKARQGFWAEKGVHFWRDGNSDAKAPTATDTGLTESLWAEPTRLPDGRYTTYVPPRAVLEFLENPTRENAAKYLKWQTERMEKLKKAASVLAEVEREKSDTVAKVEVPVTSAVTITYFKKAG